MARDDVIPETQSTGHSSHSDTSPNLTANRTLNTKTKSKGKDRSNMRGSQAPTTQRKRGDIELKGKGKAKGKTKGTRGTSTQTMSNKPQEVEKRGRGRPRAGTNKKRGRPRKKILVEEEEEEDEGENEQQEDTRGKVDSRKGEPSQETDPTSSQVSWYTAKFIMAETRERYRIAWEGIDPETGQAWKPSWEPKCNASAGLIAAWEAKQVGEDQSDDDDDDEEEEEENVTNLNAKPRGRPAGAEPKNLKPSRPPKAPPSKGKQGTSAGANPTFFIDIPLTDKGRPSQNPLKPEANNQKDKTNMDPAPVESQKSPNFSNARKRKRIIDSDSEEEEEEAGTRSTQRIPIIHSSTPIRSPSDNGKQDSPARNDVELPAGTQATTHVSETLDSLRIISPEELRRSIPEEDGQPSPQLLRQLVARGRDPDQELPVKELDLETSKGKGKDTDILAPDSQSPVPALEPEPEPQEPEPAMLVTRGLIEGATSALSEPKRRRKQPSFPGLEPSHDHLFKQSRRSSVSLQEKKMVNIFPPRFSSGPTDAPVVTGPSRLGRTMVATQISEVTDDIEEEDSSPFKAGGYLKANKKGNNSRQQPDETRLSFTGESIDLDPSPTDRRYQNEEREWEGSTPGLEGDNGSGSSRSGREDEDLEMQFAHQGRYEQEAGSTEEPIIVNDELLDRVVGAKSNKEALRAVEESQESSQSHSQSQKSQKSSQSQHSQGLKFNPRPEILTVGMASIDPLPAPSQASQERSSQMRGLDSGITPLLGQDDTAARPLSRKRSHEDGEEAAPSEQALKKGRFDEQLDGVAAAEYPTNPSAPDLQARLRELEQNNTTLLADNVILQTEISGLKSQIDTLNKNLEQAQRSKESANRDTDYARELYSQASATAVERAKETKIAEQLVVGLQRQLDTGMKELEGFHEARQEKLKEENRKLRKEINLLKEGERRADELGDVIRENAARWLAFEERRQLEEYEERERKRGVREQIQRQRDEEVEEEEANNAGRDDGEASDDGKGDGEVDFEGFVCEWMEVPGERCRTVAVDRKYLLRHVLEDHLGEKALGDYSDESDSDDGESQATNSTF